MEYYVRVQDLESNKEFKKEFYSPYLLRKFITKLKYSKKLRVISHNLPLER